MLALKFELKFLAALHAEVLVCQLAHVFQPVDAVSIHVEHATCPPPMPRPATSTSAAGIAAFLTLTSGPDDVAGNAIFWGGVRAPIGSPRISSLSKSESVRRGGPIGLAPVCAGELACA